MHLSVLVSPVRNSCQDVRDHKDEAQKGKQQSRHKVNLVAAMLVSEEIHWTVNFVQKPGNGIAARAIPAILSEVVSVGTPLPITKAYMLIQ